MANATTPDTRNGAVVVAILRLAVAALVAAAVVPPWRRPLGAP